MKTGDDLLQALLGNDVETIAEGVSVEANKRLD